MKKIITAAILCILSTSLFAQGAKTGLVIGANIGGADTSKYDAAGATNHSRTQGGLITGATIGYNYALTQNISLGLETGYSYGYNLVSLQVNALDKSKLNQWYIPLLIVGKYVFNNGFNVFAKGGVTYVHQQITNTDSYFAPGTKGNNTAFLPTVAAGLGYQFNNGLEIGGQFSYLFGSTANIGANDSLDGNKIKVSASGSLTAYINYTLPM